MKVNLPKVYDVQFTLEELNAIRDAGRALNEVTEAFGDQLTLLSAETGECVRLEELNRVRGILDFFYNHRIFEVV